MQWCHSFLSVLRLLKAFQVALNFSSHINIFACQSPTCPTIFFFGKAKIYTFKDVDCKKDHQEGPYLNHLGKKLTIAFKTPSLAAIVVCWRIQEKSKFEIIAWSFTTDNIHP